MPPGPIASREMIGPREASPPAAAPSGSLDAITAPSRGAPRGERPDQVEAAGVLEQHARSAGPSVSPVQIARP